MLSERFADDGIPLLELNGLQLAMKRAVEDRIATGEYRFEAADCPVCAGAGLLLLARKDRYGLSMTVQACKGCGLVLTTPRMTEDTCSAFYDREYRRLYGGESRPALPFVYDQYCRGRVILDSLRPFLRKPASETLVLEVGCGAGGILYAFREEGFAVRGIDLGQEYVQYGRAHLGLDLTCDTLESVGLPRQADIVVYSHVFEHILDLPREVGLIRERLAADGLLFIEVPGIRNIGQAYGGDFLRYLQNAHTYHFTLTSLTRIMAACGMRRLSGDEHVRAVFEAAPVGTALDLPPSEFEAVVRFLGDLELRHDVLALGREIWAEAGPTRILLAPDWDQPSQDWADALNALLDRAAQWQHVPTVAVTLPPHCLDAPPAQLLEAADRTVLDILAVPRPEESMGWLALVSGATMLVEAPAQREALAAAGQLGTRILRLEP